MENSTDSITPNDDATELGTRILGDDDKTRILKPKNQTRRYSKISDFSAETKGESPVNIGVGTVINQRFTLQKLLGRGGMGDVYLATDERKLEAQDTSPYIAIKLLGENFKHHPQAFIALQREARKTQQLAHPNIVTVYDFDRQADTVYLTMEALKGDPMDEKIKTLFKDLPHKTIIDIINQCARGLAYAHKKGLVHSDLKPGNIFITEDNYVKLLDFGIARAFNSGIALEKNTANHKHDTVFDAGELGALTPAYASLEMILGQAPTPSDDIYALGLITYELLTGTHPFAHVKEDTALEENMKPERITGISKQQWQAIEQSLSFKHEDRQANAEDFYQTFNRKSRKPLITASIAVAAAFILVATLNLWFRPDNGPEIAYQDLPVTTQNDIQLQLSEAQTAMNFSDYNAAILHLNRAYALHPKNNEVMENIDVVVTKLLIHLNNDKNYDQTSRNKQIKALLKYPSLRNNSALKASLNQ